MHKQTECLYQALFFPLFLAPGYQASIIVKEVEEQLSQEVNEIALKLNLCEKLATLRL